MCRMHVSKMGQHCGLKGYPTAAGKVCLLQHEAHYTIAAISLKDKSFKKLWQLLSLKRKWVSPRISVSDLKLLSDSLRQLHHLLPRAALIYHFFCPEPFNQMAKEEMPKNRVCNRWWTSFEVHREAVSTVTSPIPPHWHSHTWNIWMVSHGCVCSGDAEPTLHWSQRPCRSLGTCEGEYLTVCSKEHSDTEI